ncbi:unnamed protein product [Phytophthora lilii]|uniref:Unnamed protein product n=1 Tax=Phytophthora lilii TaxID=2077276 RepID=A0A9W6TXC5_9STRA|nr:unnamed protein product [Phytophthora lilii]
MTVDTNPCDLYSPLGGLILKMGSLYLDERVVQLVTNAAIITNMMTLIYAAFSILDEKRNAIKKAQRRSREDHRRSIAAHVRKLWRKAYGYALTEIYLNDPNSGPMPLLVMMELARREKYQQELDDLNAQLELTSTISPPLKDLRDDTMSASQVNVLENKPDQLNDDEVERNDEPTQPNDTNVFVMANDAAEEYLNASDDDEAEHHARAVSTDDAVEPEERELIASADHAAGLQSKV